MYLLIYIMTPDFSILARHSLDIDMFAASKQGRKKGRERERERGRKEGMKGRKEEAEGRRE